MRMVSAHDVPAAHVVLIGGNEGLIGIVVERGSRMSDVDPTLPVRVLRLKDGEVTNLAGTELVVDFGRLEAEPSAGYRVFVSNRGNQS